MADKTNDEQSYFYDFRWKNQDGSIEKTGKLGKVKLPPGQDIADFAHEVQADLKNFHGVEAFGLEIYPPGADPSDETKLPLKPKQKLGRVKEDEQIRDDEADWIVVAPKPRTPEAPAPAPAPLANQEPPSKRPRFAVPPMVKSFSRLQPTTQSQSVSDLCNLSVILDELLVDLHDWNPALPDGLDESFAGESYDEIFKDACSLLNRPGVHVYNVGNDASLTQHQEIETRLATTDTRCLKATIGDYVFLIGGNPNLKLSEQRNRADLIRSPVFVIEIQSNPKTVKKAKAQWFLTVHLQLKAQVFCGPVYGAVVSNGKDPDDNGRRYIHPLRYDAVGGNSDGKYPLNPSSLAAIIEAAIQENVSAVFAGDCLV